MSLAASETTLVSRRKPLNTRPHHRRGSRDQAHAGLESGYQRPGACSQPAIAPAACAAAHASPTSRREPPQTTFACRYAVDPPPLQAAKPQRAAPWPRRRSRCGRSQENPVLSPLGNFMVQYRLYTRRRPTLGQRSGSLHRHPRPRPLRLPRRVHRPRHRQPVVKARQPAGLSRGTCPQPRNHNLPEHRRVLRPR